VLPHAARMNSMRGAKSSLAIAILMAFTPGVLCSPVCALSCAVYGCSVWSGKDPSKGVGRQKSCQGHDLAPTPENQKGPQRCPGHFGASAQTPSCLLSGQTLQALLGIHSSSALLLLELPSSPDQPLVAASTIAQRPPPSPLLLRI